MQHRRFFYVKAAPSSIYSLCQKGSKGYNLVTLKKEDPTMNRRWKGTAAALAAALALHMPAAASSIRIDETTLTSEEGWVENGTSYITLRAYAQLSFCSLRKCF